VATIIDEVIIDGQEIVAVWDPQEIWRQSGFKGLAVFANGKWDTIDVIAGVLNFGDRLWTKEQLLKEDPRWAKAFDRIEDGLKPAIAKKKCSCGAHAVYGKDWPGHSPTCFINQEYFGPSIPKNNDGRTTCWKCGQPTVSKPCWNNESNLCANRDCSWHDK